MCTLLQDHSGSHSDTANLHRNIHMINLKREGLPVLNQAHLAQACTAVIPQAHHKSLHTLHHLSLRKNTKQAKPKRRKCQKRRKENGKVLRVTQTVILTLHKQNVEISTIRGVQGDDAVLSVSSIFNI